MFKLEKPSEITWPVTVNVPRDGGTTTKAVFTGKFKILPGAEFNAIYSGGGNDEDLCRNVVTGWGPDVSDQEGNPLPFNDENINKMIAIPYVRSGLVAAYLELSQGRKAAAKN